MDSFAKAIKRIEDEKLGPIQDRLTQKQKEFFQAVKTLDEKSLKALRAKQYR